MGRRSKNNNKNNQPHTQASVSTYQPNTQIQTTEPPNKRKKRIQPVEQTTQVQVPRQSVFDRLGTKNSGAAPLPRQPTIKKEVKEHLSGIETRKSRRISDARKAEREQLEGEPKQESTQDDKNKSEGGTKRNTAISKINPNNTVKGGKREEPRPLRRNSHKQLEQKQTVGEDDFQESEIPSTSKDIQREEMEDNTKTFQEMPKADISPQSPAEYNVQNAERVLNEIKDGGNDETSENFVGSTEFIVQQQNNAVYEHISGLAQSDHESDIAKEDVVSIQADDDYLMGIEDEDQEDPSFMGEQFADQEFGESDQLFTSRSDRNMSPIPDSYKDRERKEHGRNKDIDNKEIPSRIRNRATNSDDGRNSDRSYDRPSRETSIQQSHVDDRRTRLYERDIREREREERYNRAIATDRAHDDRSFDRDRRERERQDRYNKSLLEDKAHLDIPRRNERDRFQREFERNRNDHGSRTPNAETSSNSTIRGATSRSPSDSDKPPSRTRSPERIKREDRELRPRDDVREWQPHQDFQRDRDRISRQRDDLSNRDRDPRIRDLSKEKEISSRDLKVQDRDSLNLRRNDQIDVTFRRSDERISNARRLDDPRNVGIPERNPRDPPPRDREKDGHYHRDQALRPEPIRRDERQPAVRSKNETQNDSVYQDNRDKEPRQRNIQPNVLTEHDRPDKRKREDIELNERKAYYDREQRGDANSFNQRLPDYRIRDKEREQRHREDYPSKDGNRVVVNRDQDRDLTNRKEDRMSPTHDRNVGIPDHYRPLSDHLKEPDRRSLREYERDYNIDKYRVDYDRDMRDRVRDDHESRSNSVERTDPQKHLYDRHQRELEKRRDMEDDPVPRTSRSESTRRSDTERPAQTLMDNQRDNIRDYSQEAHMQEEKNRDPQDQFIKESKRVPVNEDEDSLPPHPWIKCKSSRNKDYYFNTQTRESQWNYPETGKNRQTQNDGNKNIDYDPHKDEDEPRKKIRLNENGESVVANSDINPQIGHEDKTSTVNENDSINKEVSLKDEISFDQQSELSSRLPRNNSTFLFSPSLPQSQPSPGASAAFSPPHRSISSEYNERRFSSDYGIQSSPRRGSYVGPQPHSPQMSSLRSNPGPFNRGGSVDIYDRNDGFRNDEFISSRSLGDPRNISSPSGNNNNGLTPTFPGSPIRSNRSGMYNSFGIEQNVSPGSRRSGVGRELPTFTQPRVRTVHEEERQYCGEEQSMKVEELPTNEVHNHEVESGNQTTVGQGYETFNEQNADEESDEDTWRSDEPVEYGTAETEPVSIFLFRRASSRVNQGGVKKKFLNPRKEYEVVKSICGGKGMHLFKHSFATAHSRRE
ncbi:9_t:CDS:2 [Rhizophagus irregularis]|nr:9_t:CDS:2 [Rhizophagus irregularis]